MYFYVEYINDGVVARGSGGGGGRGERRWKMCKFGDFAIMNSEHGHDIHTQSLDCITEHNQISGINMNVSTLTWRRLSTKMTAYHTIWASFVHKDWDSEWSSRTGRQREREGKEKHWTWFFRLIWEAVISACQCTSERIRNGRGNEWMWSRKFSTLYISFGMFCMICSFRPCIIRFSVLPPFPCSGWRELKNLLNCIRLRLLLLLSNYAVNILQNTNMCAPLEAPMAFPKQFQPFNENTWMHKCEETNVRTTVTFLRTYKWASTFLPLSGNKIFVNFCNQSQANILTFT